MRRDSVPGGELLHSVRTGEPAFPRVYGMKVFEYTAANPEVGEAFNEAMAEKHAARRAGRGGPVRLLALRHAGGRRRQRRHPAGRCPCGVPAVAGHPAGHPHRLRGAGGTLAAAGVADRCQVVPGDFFESVPTGGYAYLLKAVIHDLDDEHCVRILKSVRAAIPDSGTLLLVEPVIPTGPGRTPTVRMVTSDLNMLLYTGGRERTDEEFRALLAKASFQLADIIDPIRPLDSRVLTARPA